MTKALAGNLFFKDYDFDLQLLRTLGHIYDNGADFGECMATAFNITDGDYESWYEAWNNTAARIETIAEQSLDRGHIVSARRAYFRATEYYRQAEYFLREDITDPRSQGLGHKIRDCFQSAVKTIFPAVEIMRIPFQDVSLPAYFFQADDATGPAPTVIILGGYDSFAEESYFLGGRAALIRGFNVLLFDGPGQGHVLRDQEVHFHSDWDRVIEPVLEKVLTCPNVDPKRLILLGRNLAGFLALKAASVHSDKLGALVLDPGQWDIALTLRKQLSAELLMLYDTKNYQEFDKQLLAKFDDDPHLRYFFKSRMAAHGLNKPSEYFIELANYKVVASEIGNIHCPTAVCVSSDDFIAGEQSKYVYDNLTCEKHYFEFTFDEGAGDRNEFGAPALFYLRIFDWLDDVFGITKKDVKVKD